MNDKQKQGGKTEIMFGSTKKSIPTPLKVIVNSEGEGVSAVKLDKENYKAKIDI